jgi:hypothetical protein
MARKSLGPIQYAFAMYVTHNAYPLNYVLRWRTLPEDTFEALVTITSEGIRQRVEGVLSDLPQNRDTDIIRQYHDREYGPGQVSPSAEYVSSLLRRDLRSSQNVVVVSSEDKYFLWCATPTLDLDMVREFIDHSSFLWYPTGDIDTPWVAQVEHAVIEAKTCIFPMEPLYSIVVNGEHRTYMNDWPRTWRRTNQRPPETVQLTPPRPNVFHRLAHDLEVGGWYEVHPQGPLKFEES